MERPASPSGPRQPEARHGSWPRSRRSKGHEGLQGTEIRFPRSVRVRSAPAAGCTQDDRGP
eukprot:8207241-Alexandrium_andersonii.AAC.1